MTAARRSLLVAAAAAVGCHASAPPPATPAPAPVAPAPIDRDHVVDGAPVPAGELRLPHVVEAYAVLVPVGADPEAVAAVLRGGAHDAGFEITEDGRAPTERGVDITTLAASELPTYLYAMDLWTYGLSDSDVDGVGAAEVAVSFRVAAPQAEAEFARRTALRLAREGARAVDGWIVDLPTLVVFTETSLDQLRRGGDAGEAFVHIEIRVAPDDDGAHLVTFGLERFGLPELYLRDVPVGYGDEANLLVLLAAETLVARSAIATPGELRIDVAALPLPSHVELAETMKRHGGAAAVTVGIVWSHGASSAPYEDPLVELVPAGDETSAAPLEVAMRALRGPRGNF